MAGVTCTPCQFSLMQQPAMLAMGAGILMDTATVTRRRVAMQSVALGILEHFELGIAGILLEPNLVSQYQDASRHVKAGDYLYLPVVGCLVFGE